MMRNLLRPRFLIGAAIILLSVAAFSLWCYAWTVRHEAASLLNDLNALTVGTATSEDAVRFVQRHQKFLDITNCQNSKCEYAFYVANTWLSRLRIEPSAQFGVTITVEGGTVTHLGAALIRTMDIYPSFHGSAGMVDEFADMPSRYSAEGHYAFPTPVGKPYLRVVVDRHADQLEREHAFAFSFRCLTKPGGGCDLSCDYLPLAWKDWRAELHTTFPNFDGVYPNSERCR